MTIRQREIEDDILDTWPDDELDDLLAGRISTLNLDVRLLIHDLMELCRQYRGQDALADVVEARLLAAADILVRVY